MVAPVKFVLAFVVTAAMAAGLVSAIALAANGNPWPLVYGVVLFIGAIGFWGCREAH